MVHVTLLQTKFYIPKSISDIVSRPRLLMMIESGIQGDLTLISASAGFGKTTLLSDWIEKSDPTIAWLSMDHGENDPAQFLIYLISALQTIAPGLGEALRGMLESSQPPPAESVLTPLINEISSINDNFVMVLDDYHVIDSRAVDEILGFFLEHMPRQMHLVMTTREDPNLPLARLRARGQLTEIRVSDLQFTESETSELLIQKMGLSISAEEVSRLEDRTEGWITGLQLAAISMQGRSDVSEFVDSFSGSHKFVLDYLMEEVLALQSEDVLAFLLQTSILNRLCGSLCDAVLLDASASGQRILEELEQSNLFLIPLDTERCWFRYHHLFAELLRQRLERDSKSSGEDGKYPESAVLHIRASEWYERNDLEIEALEHAAAAKDFRRAERLVEKGEVPLYFRGAASHVLNWLEDIPQTQLDAKPSLLVIYASTLLLVGQHTAVETKLQAAEAALPTSGGDNCSTDLEGRIASIRATLAVIQNDAEIIFEQSQQAKERLSTENGIFQTIANWTSGVAYQLKGDREAAGEAYEKTISIGCDSLYKTAATITLGQIQESNNQLELAAKTYQDGIRLAGDPTHTIACEAYLGLARIHYEWNDLNTALEFGEQGLELTRHSESIDSFASYKIIHARLMFAGGDWQEAESELNEAEEYVQRNHFEFRMPGIAEEQIRILLQKKGDPAAAMELAEKYNLPLSRARIHLHQNNPSRALEILGPLQIQMESAGYRDELLKTFILQALSHSANGAKDKAADHLADAMTLVEKERFIRTFLDEGKAMASLLSEALVKRTVPKYTEKLLDAFISKDQSDGKGVKSVLPEFLSERELEILTLIAEGLKNKEIGEKLFISLNTVLYHTKNLYGKLGVNKRTLAIAKARELKLI